MMNKNVKQYVDESQFNRQMQRMSGRLGVVSQYDPAQNTATVMITKEQTDEIEEIVTNVMCPRTLGVQTVAPSPGIMCWVVFKDNNITQPLITHFFNHRYEQFDYYKQNLTLDRMPNYLMEL
jgi:hypothetical protein